MKEFHFFLIFCFHLNILQASLRDTHLPLRQSPAFEENKGQVKGFDGSEHLEVKFIFQKGNLKIFLLRNGLAYQFEKQNNLKNNIRLENTTFENSYDSLTNIETYRMDMELIGSNTNAEIIKDERSNDYSNYYNHEALDVHSFKKIIYRNIYKGIDWVIYITENNELKYDFIVNPGADYKEIRMKYNHAEQIIQDDIGNIIIRNRMGDIVENKPKVLQNNEKLDSKFILENNVIRFEIAQYNTSKLLTIDPKIEWSTYYGSAQSLGTKLRIDYAKNIIMIGRTNSTTNIANGGFQNSYGGGFTDLFIVKLDSNQNRLWASYYGGSGEELGNGRSDLIIDSYNNIYFCGRSTSSNNISYNGFQNSKIGANSAFLVKFSPQGTRIWATYFGENSTGNNIEIDRNHNIYLVGEISSNSSQNYSHNGFKNSYSYSSDSVDAFIVKFDSAGNRLRASYYGGVRFDNGIDIAVDSFFNIYLVGQTNSDTGISYAGDYNSFGGGISDGFIVKFDSSFNRVWASYFGGSSTDGIESIVLYPDSSLVISGGTQSNSRIYSNGFRSTPYFSSRNGFIARLNQNGSFLWSSYLEGTGDLTIDQKGFIYTSGYTAVSGLGYRGIQNNLAGSFDVIIHKINKYCQLVWATYFGGTQSEGNQPGCVTDKNLNFYFCGLTNSSNLAYNGYQNSLLPNAGSVNAFLTKLSCNRDTSLYDTICRGDTLIFNGIPRTQSGDYLDTLETWDICDSFITMKLTVSRRDTTHLFDTICQGTSRTWNGNQLTTSGVYLDTMINAERCDSFLVYHLTVRPLDTTLLYDTSCGNTLRVWNGMNLTASGIYLDTLSNQYGCDSFLFYHYVSKPIRHSTDTAKICRGTTYHGHTTSGTYSDTLRSAIGCDSVVSLYLTVLDTSSTAWTASICSGSYYLFQGDTLRSAGHYRDTLKNRNGCDSFLTLTLLMKSSASKIIFDTLCPEKTYRFGTKILSKSGIYRDSLKAKNGCDSLVTLNLFVRPKQQLKLIDTNYRLIATSGFTQYRWYRNGQLLTLPNLNLCPAITSGIYKVEVTEKNGCRYFSDSMVIERSSILTMKEGDLFDVFPNPAREHIYVRLLKELDRNFSCQIYSSDGRRLNSSILKISPNLFSISTRNLSPGCYLIEWHSGNIFERKRITIE